MVSSELALADVLVKCSLEAEFVQNPTTPIPPASPAQLSIAKRSGKVEKMRFPGVVSPDNYIYRLDRIESRPVSLEAAVSTEADRVRNHIVKAFTRRVAIWFGSNRNFAFLNTLPSLTRSLGKGNLRASRLECVPCRGGP